MQITRLTPDQARTLGEHFARAATYVRQVMDALRQLAVAAARALRQAAEAFAGAHSSRPVADTARMVAVRPAWQSPYGPAPRRHCS